MTDSVPVPTPDNAATVRRWVEHVYDDWRHGRVTDFDLPARAEYEDRPERTEENACPECETGVVVQLGPMEWQTGHTPFGCTDCRWTS